MNDDALRAREKAAGWIYGTLSSHWDGVTPEFVFRLVDDLFALLRRSEPQPRLSRERMQRAIMHHLDDYTRRLKDTPPGTALESATRQLLALFYGSEPQPAPSPPTCEWGRKHSRPWCCTHDVPLLCSGEEKR